MPQPPATKHVNHYQVQGSGISVSYSTTGIGGQPSFSYHDALHSLTFTGDEITSEPTEIGTLVTVTIRMTVDSGSTTFSLMVPNVNLDLDTSVPITTFGVTTTHIFSVIPAFRHGQTELYTTTQLTGTASQVVFFIPIPTPEPKAAEAAKT